MILAVPPPAMIASDHFITGCMLCTQAAETMMPAITADGVAIESKRLSSHGT